MSCWIARWWRLLSLNQPVQNYMNCSVFGWMVTDWPACPGSIEALLHGVISIGLKLLIIHVEPVSGYHMLWICIWVWKAIGEGVAVKQDSGWFLLTGKTYCEVLDKNEINNVMNHVADLQQANALFAMACFCEEFDATTWRGHQHYYYCCLELAFSHLTWNAIAKIFVILLIKIHHNHIYIMSANYWNAIFNAYYCNASC